MISRRGSFRGSLSWPEQTTTRCVADIVGIPVTGLIGAATFARSREFIWAGYSAASSFGMTGGFVIFGAAFRRTAHTAGVWERLSIAAGFGWLSALSLRALTSLRRCCWALISQGRLPRWREKAAPIEAAERPGAKSRVVRGAGAGCAAGRIRCLPGRPGHASSPCRSGRRRRAWRRGRAGAPVRRPGRGRWR